MKNYTYQKDNFTIVKKALPNNIVTFLFKYFLRKKQIAKFLKDNKYISPFEEAFGIFSDSQVPNPNTFIIYGDPAMDTILEELLPLMNKKTNLKLAPTYSYGRVYAKGDVLKRHKDREECEVSTTLNLGGEPWAIYLDPSGNKGKKGVKVILEAGDMLIYSGCRLEHWRNSFKGNVCAQVFFHYNKISDSSRTLYDGRPFLGLPSYFKTNKNT